MYKTKIHATRSRHRHPGNFKQLSPLSFASRTVIDCEINTILSIINHQASVFDRVTVTRTEDRGLVFRQRRSTQREVSHGITLATLN